MNAQERADLIRAQVRRMHEWLGSPEIHECEMPDRVKDHERTARTCDTIPDNAQSYIIQRWHTLSQYLRDDIIVASWFTLTQGETRVMQEFQTRRRPDRSLLSVKK